MKYVFSSNESNTYNILKELKQGFIKPLLNIHTTTINFTNKERIEIEIIKLHDLVPLHPRTRVLA